MIKHLIVLTSVSFLSLNLTAAGRRVSSSPVPPLDLSRVVADDGPRAHRESDSKDEAVLAARIRRTTIDLIGSVLQQRDRLNELIASCSNNGWDVPRHPQTFQDYQNLCQNLQEAKLRLESSPPRRVGLDSVSRGCCLAFDYADRLIQRASNIAQFSPRTITAPRG